MSRPNPTPIYRITHFRNVPWILEHGCHCRSSSVQDPNFINIGSSELIDKRAHRVAVVAPGGPLNDYVPFYFAPHSMMLYNIHTNRVEGVRVGQQEIVYHVSSIQRLQELGLTFVFTDGHALANNTHFFNDPSGLDGLDWETIGSRDFRRREEDLDRSRRYQAECLVHGGVPLEGILEIWCFDAARENFLHGEVESRQSSVKILKKAQFYF